MSSTFVPGKTKVCRSGRVQLIGAGVPASEDRENPPNDLMNLLTSVPLAPRQGEYNPRNLASS